MGVVGSTESRVVDLWDLRRSVRVAGVGGTDCGESAMMVATDRYGGRGANHFDCWMMDEVAWRWRELGGEVRCRWETC